MERTYHLAGPVLELVVCCGDVRVQELIEVSYEAIRGGCEIKELRSEVAKRLGVSYRHLERRIKQAQEWRKSDKGTSLGQKERELPSRKQGNPPVV